MDITVLSGELIQLVIALLLAGAFTGVLAGLFGITHLGVSTSDVQAVLGAALRCHCREALRGELFMTLHRGPAIAELDRRGGLV